MSQCSLEVETYPLTENSLGVATHLNLFRLSWGLPGPRVFLPASVHGAEVQGNLVLFHLMKWAKEHSFRGELCLLPLANPSATGTKIGTQTYGRFNPVTGHNWNRNYHDLAKYLGSEKIDAFALKHKAHTIDEIKKNFQKLLSECLDQIQKEEKDYGQKENGQVNWWLQKLSIECDLVLDLHTGPVACRYLYAPEALKESAKYLKIPYTLIVPHEFGGAFDEAVFVPWAKLQEAFKKIGVDHPLIVESYTVEFGSEEKISSAEAQIDLDRLLTYFHFKKIIDQAPQTKELNTPQFYSALKDYKTYYAPRGGLYEYIIKPGTHYSKGETLASCLNFEGLKTLSKLSEQQTILKAQKAGVLINHFPSAVVGSGMELMQVMENLQKFD